MPKRAANNMGNVRKRSDGHWEGRYTAPDGKQHSVYGKTAAACTAALRAAQIQNFTDCQSLIMQNDESMLVNFGSYMDKYEE